MGAGSSHSLDRHPPHQPEPTWERRDIPNRAVGHRGRRQDLPAGGPRPPGHEPGRGVRLLRPQGRTGRRRHRPLPGHGRHRDQGSRRDPGAGRGRGDPHGPAAAALHPARRRHLRAAALGQERDHDRGPALPGRARAGPAGHVRRGGPGRRRDPVRDRDEPRLRAGTARARADRGLHRRAADRGGRAAQRGLDARPRLRVHRDGDGLRSGGPGSAGRLARGPLRPAVRRGHRLHLRPDAGGSRRDPSGSQGGGGRARPAGRGRAHQGRDGRGDRVAVARDQRRTAVPDPVDHLDDGPGARRLRWPPPLDRGDRGPA